ncbi:MAG: leucine-rich repeat domain-containing protein, partial [Candidatus Methanomethylophilaceae archaeon]|nr:leucine-rich repeat domain-containing protein [Candidatus Methanomethylophilaceae archaeon]
MKSLWGLLALVAVLAVAALAVSSAPESDAEARGACGNDLSWTLYDDGTLGIQGTGKMYDYDYLSNRAPWGTGVKSVAISSGVTSIGSYAFYGCTSLSSATILSSVTSIGEGAFEGCTSLSSVEIPSSVTSIGERAFFGCTSLSSVNIPSSVVEIGVSAFSGCTSLDRFSGTYVGISSDGVLLRNEKVLVSCAAGPGATSAVIPNSTTSIGSYAFYNCSFLSSVTIPSNVKTIGVSAFEGCTSLSSVMIPSSVTSVKSGAFFGCSSLEAIDVDSGNAKYSSSDGVLFNKAKTELVTFPAGKQVTEYSVPSTVTSIKSYAFEGSVVSSVYVPAAVTSIGAYAFRGCSSLEAIDVDSGNAEYSSSDGVLFDKAKTVLIAYPAMKQGTEYSVPATVTSIKSYAFEG